VLEDNKVASTGEHSIGCCVVQRESVEVEICTAARLDVLESGTDDREVSQAEEVHLEQGLRCAAI